VPRVIFFFKLQVLYLYYFFTKENDLYMHINIYIYYKQSNDVKRQKGVLIFQQIFKPILQ